MIKNRKITIVTISVLLSILLTGCIPDYVPEDYEAATIEEGSKIIRDYLRQESISYESEELSLVTGTAIGGAVGNYPTDYVKGTYKSGENEYTVYSNVKTGEIFSNVNIALVNKAINDSLSNIFAESLPHGVSMVSNYSKNTQIQSKDMRTTNKDLPYAEVIESIFGVIPSDINSANVKEYLDDIIDNSDDYSFDIYTSDDISQIDNDFFKMIQKVYPGVHAVYVYVVDQYSMDSLICEGHLDSGYLMTIKGEYHCILDDDNFTYIHYNDSVSGKYAIHYIDYIDKNGTVKNYHPTLVRDVENPNVVYIKSPGFGISYFYFTEDPGDCTITHFYKDHKSGKYKHAQKMSIKNFDNGKISVYIDDVLDFDEKGFPVSSDIAIKLKY